MEYWIFQPQSNITPLEIANLVGKLKNIDETSRLFVPDAVYDTMPNEYKRHFRLFLKAVPYEDYPNG